ncbi:tripartite tricarboxylate transporter family receptor [Variibacter gotjawalensis]|uniref:Tripartite tricarboxylate transporter family receptor n=1 Tax=Variibacter gotjawalensis TaxID=1333996 RepID=A0A0S3PUU3_9BRAD|nr:tripartite tricarboxylate transporter substrate binding protein [Variibacter gotjawalensis]NIK50069.1 tripartite-type tricarboxylate transporter receptor subunit TctC [Variibacter gotjawalensis]RZS46068.1 tripartite-type tricarboxylate transporter receptor subunit TctC [Variibacter gotjawalensis]BAT59743.1 tripartite tricarboxylate transporter family receptor [Variibacter gotjawalensis]
MLTRRRLIATAALAMPALLPRQALTQAWPNRPIRLIVPYPAGGGADAIARIVGAKLAEMWGGAQLVYENRGGAGGNLASELAARSQPDGYTLYLAGEFQSTNLHVYPKLSYDPVADFSPVSLVVQYPAVIAVPNSSPAKTLQEFVEFAKTKSLTFATPGHGTGPHLAGELFAQKAGIKLQHVPYRGAAPAIQDLIPGRVDSFFNNIAAVVPFMKDQQVRGLAVTTAKRTPAMPDLPTFAESGLKDFDVSGWYAFYVPAKTPDDIVKKMHADTVTALADPSVKSKLEGLGLFVVGSTPQELGAFLKAEIDKWGPVIRDAGIKVRE